jgi:hypothetical protein
VDTTIAPTQNADSVGGQRADNSIASANQRASAPVVSALGSTTTRHYLSSAAQ